METIDLSHSGAPFEYSAATLARARKALASGRVVQRRGTLVAWCVSASNPDTYYKTVATLSEDRQTVLGVTCTCAAGTTNPRPACWHAAALEMNLLAEITEDYL